MGKSIRPLRGTGKNIGLVDHSDSLGATARFDVAPGDQLTIETPGGGGFGSTGGQRSEGA